MFVFVSVLFKLIIWKYLTALVAVFLALSVALTIILYEPSDNPAVLDIVITPFLLILATFSYLIPYLSSTKTFNLIFLALVLLSFAFILPFIFTESPDFINI